MTSTLIPTQSSCADDREFGSLSFEAARQRMLDAIAPTQGFERIDLADGVNRILNRAIVSPMDVPAHTNSAVDGYALRGTDLPTQGGTARLAVVGTALAGRPYDGEVGPQQAVRITTGAIMPPGSDTVVMQEQVEKIGLTLQVGHRHRPGQNVRHAGEDTRRGETILQPGRRLTPADLGLIASLGIGEIDVRPRLRVALASTGDEIAGIGAPLPAGSVYDSNRYALSAALSGLGAEVIHLGIIPDDKNTLLTTLTSVADSVDAIVSSGGVSVGAADYTKEALRTLGGVAFWRIAIKPGRPLAFGNIGDALFFGLPGNPVAVLVTFYQFVLPALEKKMGLTEKPLAPLITAECLDAIRKKPGRTEFQRGILARRENGGWQVRTTGKQGSGILRSMSLANAFIILPHEGSDVAPGDPVTVQPFAGLI